MSLLDLILVACVGALAVAAPRLRRRALLGAAAALSAGFALQLAVEGFYWQFAPAYVVAAVSTGLSLRPARPARLGWIATAALALAVLFTAGPWLLFTPVPALPAPTGPYAVGAQVFRWIDVGRPETATQDPSDRRNVVVQAWYPAARDAKGAGLDYIDGLGRLPPKVSLIPRFLMRAYGRIDTHAVAGAPMAVDRATWPVVLFSPGADASRAFYSGLAADLASRGFVVLVLDHPYDSAVTQLADGRLVATLTDLPPGEASQMSYMATKQAIRAADFRFVVDQIDRPGAFAGPLDGRLDRARIAAAGHSFGGAAAVAATQGDSRLLAAVDIDGTFYGGIGDKGLDRPFLLVESDHAETRHGDRYTEGVDRLFAHMRAPSRRIEIKRANHFSFTDAPLFLAPPARWAAARVIGGELGPARTQRRTAEVMTAFLKGAG